VLEEALNAGARRFIHISSTAVYGVPDHHPLFEHDQLVGVGPYGMAKIQAEGVCLEFRQKGLCVPILRPKSFVGPERLGVFAIFYEWASEGKNFPMIGSGANRYQLLDVEDLCAAIHLCMILDESAANDTFNIGAGEFTTMRQDYQAVLDEAGFGKRIVGFPRAGCANCSGKLKLPLRGFTFRLQDRSSPSKKPKAARLRRVLNRDALVRNFRFSATAHTAT
jgi:nucleoside-diphosphate-sugar epimerase